eukprot:m.177505 g.177505  ORF g.177505 m.177505 type:complete len:881 (+) comp39162_c0_seq17:512-3154(+)
MVSFVLEIGAGSGFGALDNVQFLSCLKCTFENGICGWTTSEVETPGDSRWLLRDEASGANPPVDHTTARVVGNYLYVDTRKSVGRKAQLTSRLISGDENICSVVFYTQMYGLGLNTFKLRSVLENEDVFQNWDLLSTTLDQWVYRERRMQFPLVTDPSRAVRLQFVATIFQTGQNIALDDIEYLPCSTTEKCTFSQGMCSWNYGASEGDQTKQVQWKVLPSQGRIEHRLVANFSSDGIPGNQQAVLEGRLLLEKDGICSLRFEYELTSGLYNSTLLVSVHHPGKNQFNEYVSVQQEKGIRFREVAFFPNRVPFVYIQSQRKGGEKGAFIIHSLHYLSCSYSSFETKKHGNWRDSSNNFGSQWIHLRAGECSSSLCPLHDHTYGERQPGTYYLAQHTDLRSLGEARLTRSNLTATYCGVRFWYYASSAKVELRVETSPLTTVEKHEVPILRTKSWTFHEVTLNVRNSDLIFVTSGLGSDSGLALDDVDLTPCPGKYECSFEKYLCGWTPADEKSGNATWIRWQGIAPTGKTSKTVTAATAKDHTKKTSKGYYLAFAVLDNQKRQPHAILKGVPIGSNSDVCGVKFWYSKPGCQPAWMWVSVVYSTETYIVWTDTSSTGSADWQYGQALFRLVRKEAGHVEFHAQTENNCGMAIDDVDYVFCSEILQKVPDLTQSLVTLPPDTVGHSTHGYSTHEPTRGFQPVDGKDSEGGAPVGAIVGSVVGVILLLVLIVVILLVLRRRHSSQGSAAIAESSPANGNVKKLDNPSYGGLRNDSRALHSVLPDAPEYATPDLIVTVQTNLDTNGERPKHRYDYIADPSGHEYAELNSSTLQSPSKYNKPWMTEQKPSDNIICVLPENRRSVNPDEPAIENDYEPMSLSHNA